MTPYHLELIRQTFDGLFGRPHLIPPARPPPRHRWEEDEPEREPSSVFASHLRLGAKFVLCWSPPPPHTAPGRPLPRPYRPGPTADPARPTTPASGAVEHKDKGTGAARPILDDDDVPSRPSQEAAPAAAKPRRIARPRRGKKAAPVAAKRTPGRGTGTNPAPVEISSSSSDGAAVPRPKAKAERKRARPTDPDDFSPEAARQVLQSVVDLGLFDLSLSEKCHGKRAHVLLSSIDPCPSLARPLPTSASGNCGMVRELGAAVLFSIIVQTSALDEARYQVVDGSHRFQVARIIVDPRRGGEAQQATPQIRQHLKEDYIDVAVYNTLDPEAMLELQHRVNLLTHDARFGSSTFDVLLNLKRASLQAPSATSVRILTLPHIWNPPSRAALPQGEDAPAKLVKILECFSLEMLCALSQLPVERQPSATNLWRIFEPTMQLRWPPETTPVLYLPPTRPPGDPAVPSRPDRDLCLHELPQRAALPIPQGQVRLPAFSEELGELGCPFERLNETDVGNMPQEITFMDGRRLSEFELVLGYWLGWCAAQLPPAMQDYLMPEHCPYARLWEEMGHHDIPVPASAC
ncbi:hypothetical protein PAPYR_12022 [Paratrimastix pyriformis]|uniref:Uncharacterized protein n=1 Tax=Paratrimastix pyriformis TaxID=342808 RepID=A0ABQ8U2N7_9EUKA|nr:hypothetical protein PAPYR_12022 [Paratrimastix pyriformis]